MFEQPGACIIQGTPLLVVCRSFYGPSRGFRVRERETQGPTCNCIYMEQLPAHPKPAHLVSQCVYASVGMRKHELPTTAERCCLRDYVRLSESRGGDDITPPRIGSESCMQLTHWRSIRANQRVSAPSHFPQWSCRRGSWRLPMPNHRPSFVA